MRVTSRIQMRHIATAFLAVSSAAAGTTHFHNSYVSFDMPDGWTCKVEETEYVCYPPPPGVRHSMGVILTAKMVGGVDSPQLYLRHLEEVGRRPEVTVGQTPRQTLIGDSLWVDGSFWNSELRDYETRYLVRTEGDIGVLVTFSAHRSVATQAKAISDLIARSVVVNSKLARPELRQGPLIAKPDH